MRIGFTGTQAGMSAYQLDELRKILALRVEYRLFRGYSTQVHHGDCIGADAELAAIAHELGIPVVIHPPTIAAKRAWTYQTGDQVWAARPYLVRNHEIVDATDGLIAAPRVDAEELRSGTWATVRYARSIGRPVTLLKRERTP